MDAPGAAMFSVMFLAPGLSQDNKKLGKVGHRKNVDLY
jgi:hypothetical protein